MKIAFDRDGWDDHLYRQATDAKVLARLHASLADCTRETFRGGGA